MVGTAASPDVEAERAARLLAWAEVAGQSGREGSIRRWFSRPRLARSRRQDPEAVGSYAVRLLGPISSRMHSAVLGIVDELIETGAGVRVAVPSAQVAASDWLPAPKHDYIK